MSWQFFSGALETNRNTADWGTQQSKTESFSSREMLKFLIFLLCMSLTAPCNLKNYLSAHITYVLSTQQTRVGAMPCYSFSEKLKNEGWRSTYNRAGRRRIRKFSNLFHYSGKLHSLCRFVCMKIEQMFSLRLSHPPTTFSRQQQQQTLLPTLGNQRD